MSANERLGIDLGFDVDPKSITDTLNTLKKLQTDISKLFQSNATQGLEQSLSAANSKAQTLNKTLSDTNAVQGYAKSFQGIEKSIQAATASIASELSKQLKAVQGTVDSINGMKVNPVATTVQQHTASSTSTTGQPFLNPSFADLSKRLTEFYTARAAIFSVGSEFSKAAKSILDFNQSLHDTAAISNTTTDQLNKISEAALSIARNSKFSAAEVMHSMKTLAQAGVSAAQLPDVARTADFFATGTGATPEQAAKVLTTSMNVWGIQAEKAGRISNTLTAALNQSKLEVGELSTAMSYLANPAAIMGKSLEETAAAVAVLANQGLKASTIGTSMSGLLVKLSAPGDKFKDLMKEFGISLESISPRAHSFAEIIGVLEKAAIPAERILASMEQRTGRTLVTAINAGSDAFKLMTERITNSNSAAVAYNESMKGVQAQINILRGEAVTSLNEVLKSTGANFTDLRNNMQDLLVGLRSAEGQFVLFSGTVTTGIYAMGRAVAANPVLAGISAGLVLLGLGIQKVGEANRALAKEIDATTHASAEASAEYQRKADAMYSVLTLVDKSKVSEGGYLKIQDENKKKLREIMNDFPQFFSGMDIKKLKYDQITEAIKRMNAARAVELKQDVTSSNDKAEEINKLKTDLALAKRDEENSTSIWNFSQFDISGMQEKLKLAEDAYSKMLAANLQHRQDIEIYIDSMGTKRARQITPPAEKPRGRAVEIPETEKPVSAERSADIIGRLTEDQKALAEQLRFAKAKIDRESAELGLKDKTLTEQQYSDKEAAAIKLVDEEYAAKRIKDREAAFSKLAKSLNGAYDAPSEKYPSGHLTYDRRFDSKQVNGLIDATNNNLNFQSTVVDEAARKKELERIKQMQPAPDAVKLYNPALERAADRELKTRQDSLKLQEKQVMSGDELLRLQIADTDAQLRNAEAKEKAYRSDLSALGERAKLNTDEQLAYDAILGKLDATLQKQGELNVLRSDQTAGTNAAMSNGARTAWVAYSNSQKDAADLGGKLASTGLDGLTNSLDGMVTSLNRGANGWKSFSKSLATTMQGISETLQQYIVKMLVVAAVQKLIGIFVGGAANWDSGSTISNGLQFNNGAYTGQSIYGAMAGYAEGGLVPTHLGKMGVDSIPAMVQPSEFIIPASVVKAWGPDHFENYRTGAFKKFAEGGLGSNGGKAAPRVGGNNGQPTELTLVINNIADTNSIPRQPANAQEIINIVSFDINKRSTLHRQIKAVVQG